MNTLLSLFKSDGASMIDSIHRLLLSMEREPLLKEHVHEAFRFVHSLKSEASYLGHTESLGLLHSLESLLDEVRQGRKSPDKETIDGMVSLLEEVQKSISEASMDGAKVSGGAFPAPIFETVKDSAFTEFEGKLLSEAKERGEAFYRLTCDIDKSAAMKYARLFLMTSNLEQIVNLIKTEPPLDYIQKHEDTCGTIVFYFTLAGDIGRVLEAVDINEVSRNNLTPLSYDMRLPALEDKVNVQLEEGSAPPVLTDVVRMDRALFDDLVGNVNRIRKRIEELKSKSVQNGGDVVSEEVRHLLGISDSLEDLLRKVRMVSLKEKEGQLSRFVGELSRRLNKNLNFFTLGFDVEVDRTVVEILHECIVHLVRNAVDHGIETETNRRSAAKPETGGVIVSIMKRGDVLCVQVLDDGAGILEGEIRRRALDLGYAPESISRMDLATLLARPGLSTKKEATDASGRGVGLDLVMEKLKQFPGSEVRLFTSPGEGTVFTMEIFLTHSLTNLLICRRGETILAVPKQAYTSTEKPDGRLVRSDEGGLFWYKELPVFTELGRFAGAFFEIDACSLVRMRFIDSGVQREAFLLIDEFLFEKNVTDQELKTLIQGGDALSLLAAFPGAAIRYFDPSIITK